MARPPLPPDEAIASLLPPDVHDDLTGLRHPEAVDVWYGVVWGRLGRADHAWAWWNEVSAFDLLPWIAAERGRVVRELGLHSRAERFETRGLELAEDVLDAVMLRIGLAADAIGSRSREAARLRLMAATELIASLPDGPRVARQRLRASWVEVELVGRARAEGDDGWAAGDPAPTLDERLPRWEDAGPVWPPDYDHGSAFHRAKGLLFAGIHRADVRLLDAAADLAPPVLLWAVHLARVDHDRAGALRLAREAWSQIVPPPGLEREVARTATARRLGSGRGATT